MFYYYALFTSLYSTIYWDVFNYIAYWAVFKQKYDRERAYTLRLRIIYNGHSARLMHDHVTVISFTLITKLAHPNLCVPVWHWLLLSSESCSLCIMFSYRVFEPPFSLYSQRHENHISPPKHRILERWIRSITPDLSDNVFLKKTFVSHLFGSTVFAVFYFKHCLTPNCCWY